MSEQWYYHQDGQTRGPLPLQQLQQMQKQGVLDPQTSVIRTGMKDWTPLDSLNAAPEPITPPPLPQKPAAPESPRQQAPPARPRRLPAAKSRSWLPVMITAAAAVVLLAGLSVLAISTGLIRSAAPQPMAQRTVQPLVAAEVEEVESQPVPSPAAEEPTEPSPAPALRTNKFAIAPPLEFDEAESVAPEPAVKEPSTEEPSFKPVAVRQPELEPPTASPEEPSQPKPAVTAKVVLQQQEAGVLYQALDIHRRPTMSVPGAMSMTQNIRYQILSELKVGEADDRGLREVSQHVIDTRLQQADASSRASFTQSLKDLVGWQFSYTIDRRGEVVEIRAPNTGAKVGEVNPKGGRGFLVTSVMDKDGWKELAALSFFNPRDENLEKQTWMRQMTHNFQPLGSWEGETRYERAGKPQQVMQINYQHDLRYKPPAAGIALEGLPLKIGAATFKAEEARGAIYFNRDTRRVQSAEERFHVRGQLTANVLGQSLVIPVEEKQEIHIGISQQNPWQNQSLLRKKR